MSLPRRVLATRAELEQRKKAALAKAERERKEAFSRTVYGAVSIRTASEANTLFERVMLVTGMTLSEIAAAADVDLRDVEEAYRERKLKPSVGLDEFWGAIMRLFDERMSLMIATRAELARLANRSQGRRIERRELMTRGGI